MNPVFESKMKMIRKLRTLYVIAGLLFANAAWSNTTEFSELAEEFFTAAHSGKYADVEKFISPQWLSAIQPDEFERFLNVLSLDDFRSANWGDGGSSEGTGELKGEFVSSDDKFPISLTYLKHQGKWMIHGISVSPATPPVNLPVPDYNAIVALVQATMRDFATAVNNRDMTSFHATAAGSARIRHGIDEYQKTFAQFFGDDDFSLRVSGVPGVAKPTLKEGYLEVLGGYEVAGYVTKFKIEYVNDKSAWKLASLGIQSNPEKD